MRAVTAVRTLLVLDASLPAGLIEGQGTMAYAHTMAFTTLVFFSLFTLFNSRSDVMSAFHDFFSNRWRWRAVALSIALHDGRLRAFPAEAVLDAAPPSRALAPLRCRGQLCPLAAAVEPRGAGSG